MILVDKTTEGDDGKFVERISLSLPNGLVSRFDDVVKARGFANRSQAVSEVLAREVDEFTAEKGTGILTGTITLVYQHNKPDLKRRLAEIQYENIAEVISSLHVLLEDRQTMEVVLVQGDGDKLRDIANQLVACKGVLKGTLNLTQSVMPQLQHPGEEKKKKK